MLAEAVTDFSQRARCGERAERSSQLPLPWLTRRPSTSSASIHASTSLGCHPFAAAVPGIPHGPVKDLQVIGTATCKDVFAEATDGDVFLRVQLRYPKTLEDE